MKRSVRIFALVISVLLLGNCFYIDGTLAGIQGRSASPAIVRAEEGETAGRSTADEPVDTTATTYVLSAEEREGKTSEEIIAQESANEQQLTQKAYEMAIATNELDGWPQGTGTYGEAAIVMEAKSGAVLYAKNIDGKAYPASITKILTALIALENADLDDKITITDDSISFLEYGDAHIGMTPGEEIPLKDALYALLLASANEVAYAIGDNVGDSYDWFIERMNSRARELGAVNSNFTNTNGLPDENHYTTARDMALITRELYLNHGEFATISQTLQYTIGATNLVSEPRTFQQMHGMFYENGSYYYAKAVAGKTGYTDEAMNTLVTCAEDGQLQLVGVVLKTHAGHVYEDMEQILEYGFQNFHKVIISENEQSEDFADIDRDAYVVLPDGVEFGSLTYTVETDAQDESKGTVTYTYEGNPVGSAQVTLSDFYLNKNKDEIQISMKKKEAAEEEKPVVSWKKWVLIGAALLIVIVALWMIFAAYIRKKRREARRRKRRRQKLQKQKLQKQKMKEQKLLEQQEKEEPHFRE